MELRDLGKRGASILHFDPRILKTKPGLNVRDLTTPENRAHVERLADGIATNGFTSIMRVFMEDDQAYVSEGHCRLAATILAIERGCQIETVPCFPEPKGTNERDIIARQFTSNDGKQLSSDEAAANIKRMLSWGKTAADVAKLINRSVSYVNQTLEFQEAPAEVREVVARGEMAQTLAATIVREEGPARATETIRKAVMTAKTSGKKKATARHVERSVAPHAARTGRDPEMVERLIARLVDEARRGNSGVQDILNDFDIYAPADLVAA